MDAHELVNLLQLRLRGALVFHEILTGFSTSAEFDWGPRRYYAVAAQDKKETTVMEVIAKNEMQFTSNAKYLQGVINGGVRNDAGELVMPQAS